MGTRVCYVDESGDTRPLHGRGSTAPVCVIVGVVFEQAAIYNLTREFIELKASWFPSLMPDGGPHLDRMLAEIKGADLRRAMRNGARRRNRRHALGFLSKFLALLEDYDAKIIGRLWVKKPGQPVSGGALYSSSIQAICGYFQHLLVDSGSEGLVIADSRAPALNAAVSHSVFTQKFKQSGDRYDRILEMPAFGHSENHAGIQIADLLASALLFPMASHAYCNGHIESVHVQDDFGLLRRRFGARLMRLQYRYQDGEERYRGGITVNDRISHSSGRKLFLVRQSQRPSRRELASPAPP